MLKTLVLLPFNVKLQISIWPLEDVHKSANDILDDANKVDYYLNSAHLNFK